MPASALPGHGSRTACLIATWFGCGLAPLAPGTVGSLGAVPLHLVLRQLPLGGHITLALLTLAGGTWAAHRYAQDRGEKDPQSVVIDEVAGQCLLLSMFTPDLTSYVVGFILFRFFDIVKPWPINIANGKIKNGFGIMVDDVLAALYPALFLFVLKVVLIFSIGMNEAPYLKLFLPVENVQ